MVSASSNPDEYFLDPRAVRRAFERASATYDQFAAVHAEVRTRLLERLDVVRLQPSLIVDLGAGTGHGSRALQDRYRSAHVVAVDQSLGMLAQARRQQRFLKRFGRVAADAHRLAIGSGRVDLLVSNLMLQWCADPDRVFAEIARVLRPGALLMFTTLGPDTLRELRATCAALDSSVHVHRFIDMHDIGDALVRAGFAEPVMDTERLTVTYPDVATLLRELQGSGSTNRTAGRLRGLRDRHFVKRLIATYPEAPLISATLEVVYGHAWIGEAKQKRQAGGEISVPMASITRRIR